MRLVGDFFDEKQADDFCSFLEKQNIASNVEPFALKGDDRRGFHVWVVEEDQYEAALGWYQRFVANPNDPLFVQENKPAVIEETVEEFQTENKSKVLRLMIKRRTHPLAFLLTYLFFFICIALFIINVVERRHIEKNEGVAAALILTPIQKELMFDYPASLQKFEELVKKEAEPHTSLSPSQVEALYRRAEQIPSWQGLNAYFTDKEKIPLLKARLFEKIGQGEFWRLFSPCLLHSDFLHILFNMAWLWVLGRQIEERIGKGRFFIIALCTGVISNVAQYLVSGPLFLGFSGIVVGMAGFIFSRQKKAPWEGYPLHKTTLMFILFFVLVMFFLEIVSFSLHFFSLYQLSPSIANTAHVSGGVAGYILGRLRFFACRRTS